MGSENVPSYIPVWLIFCCAEFVSKTGGGVVSLSSDYFISETTLLSGDQIRSSKAERKNRRRNGKAGS